MAIKYICIPLGRKYTPIDRAHTVDMFTYKIKSLEVV